VFSATAGQGAARTADQERHAPPRPGADRRDQPLRDLQQPPGSTKSYDYVREHNEAINRLDVILPLNTVETPLNRLGVAELCPGAKLLEAFNESMRHG
jgi:hypothetical protein